MAEAAVIIYQIGNMPIHLHDQLWSSDNFKSDTKALDLIGSHRTLWSDAQFQPALRTTQLSGMLLGSCGMPPARVAQNLKRMVGHPVPIIGWWDDGCCGGVCPCECHGAGCVAVWVENHGIIRGVNISNKKDGPPEISIDVEMGDYWQPLSRIAWAWSNAFTANPTEYPCDCDPFADPEPIWGGGGPAVIRDDYWKFLAPYPRCDMLFNNDCACEGFTYRGYSEYTMLNPLIWEADTKFHYPGYPSTGYSQTSDVLGGSSPTYIDNEFVIDSGKWGAPPRSLYAFRNIIPGGTISIRVERPDGLYGKQIEWTKLDTTELHQSLIDAGWGGIRTTDIVLLGDMDRMPGVILRDKRVLPNFRPLPVFDGNWPGYIEPGRVRTTISMTSGGVAAFKHEWRRL